MGLQPRSATAAPSSPGDEPSLVARLRQGDEEAFAELVTAYSGEMLRLARGYVGDRRIAEEVVQETWLAVLRGLDRFEERSSLHTWLWVIVRRIARRRANRERRAVPFTALTAAGGLPAPAVDPDRFLETADNREDRWVSTPMRFDELPEDRLLAQEMRHVVAEAVRRLPDTQRAVLALCAGAEWDARSVCDALGVSDANRRVLLHRARVRVRRALERYLEEELAS